MCTLTESNKSSDAEMDIEQDPELSPIWVVAKVHGTIINHQANIGFMKRH
jgi:hypothetical protein